MRIKIGSFRMTVRNVALAAMASVLLPQQAFGQALEFSPNELVAGWDFSQYLGPNLLSIDGAEFTDTLDANYSNLLTTGFTTGIGAGAFGRMYINGQFGSTAVPIGTGSEQIVPINPSLASNLEAPLRKFGDNQFDSFEVAINQGQFLANSLAMIVGETVDVTFRADHGNPPPAGSNWILSFGGRTTKGTSLVGIDFSDDGSGFQAAGASELTESDTPFSVDLGPATGQTVFVRFRFDPAQFPGDLPDAPIIDNVAISVPEAGGLASGVAALVGLFACRRRRA